MKPLGRVLDQRHGARPRRPRWWLTVLALAMSLSMLLAAPAFAGDSAPGTLRIGGDAHYPPYQFLDEDGRADGFDVALARAVAADLGLEPRFELGEWEVALDRLARGEIDLVPMFWSAEREQHYLFTQPILIRHHALFGTRQQARPESIEGLANVRVAVQRASLAAEAMRAQAAHGVTLLELPSESGTLVAVARGDADYALAPVGIGYYAIHQFDLDNVIALSPPLLERKYVFAARRGRADLVARIDASLERLRADGVQNDLYVEWIGNLNPHRPRRWPLLAGGLAGLFAVGLGTYAWRRKTRPARLAFAAVGDEHALMSQLRDAIAADRLGFMLQPQVDLRTGRWLGAELLVRWHHPRRGPLAPDAFVPVAERSGDIAAMTLHLVRCGLAQRRHWPRVEPPLHLSVNVSANDLADAQLVDAIIDACAGDGAALILEITETDVMREPERVAEALPRLRAHGIRISVDDFGAGHSSLVNLRRLAPDELKIDRSFVVALLTSRSDQAIVTATIGLAHELGATVAAEGIEDAATQRWLAEAGCDAGQGFGIARPMTADAFAALLRSTPSMGE